jgi:hypothetical protein
MQRGDAVWCWLVERPALAVDQPVRGRPGCKSGWLDWRASICRRKNRQKRQKTVQKSKIQTKSGLIHGTEVVLADTTETRLTAKAINSGDRFASGRDAVCVVCAEE